MGHSFFQSALRRDLQVIFGRDIIEKTLAGKAYWGVRRTKNKCGLRVGWEQILGWRDGGEDGGVLRNADGFFSGALSGWPGNVFVQRGCDEVLWRGSVGSSKESSVIDQIKLLRTHKEMDMRNKGLCPSWRENMPLATIVTPCREEEELLQLMHRGHRRDLKKAQKNQLTFDLASRDQRDSFYVLWTSLAASKGLGIMTSAQFVGMMDYLVEHDCGQLFLVMKDGEIVSGSICCWHQDEQGRRTIVYLYGATARVFGNVGGHVFLQHEIMKWGYGQGFDCFDHRGVAPLGFDHHLAGVSRFKERFGGERIEYVGNFDLVYNRVVYWVMKMWKGK